MSIVLKSVTQKMINPNFGLLIKLEDPRGFLTRIQDLYIAKKKESESRSQRLDNPLRINAQNLFPKLQGDSKTYGADKQPWQKEPSSKLAVLIHGLNSSPLAWSGYLDKIPKPISYFAPYVYKKGYCKLEDAANPILDVVQDYANLYPENPIVLVGHSNGARIAAYVEQKLNAKNIRLVSIAGPHGGSKFQKWIDKAGISESFKITPAMTEELSYLGSWPQEYLTQWQDQQKINEEIGKVVGRVFYATADDYRVFPSETSFPNLPNSRYDLISQDSHVTIVEGVMKAVLLEILKDFHVD